MWRKILAATMTANQQTWQSDLEQHGMVTINSTFGSLLWRVGIAVALVAFFVYARYSAGDIGQRGLTFAVIGFVLFIAGCVAFVVKQYGGKSLSVDSHGITLIDGRTMPWTDISSVDVFSAAKTPPSVAVNLTEAAWDAHMSQQHAAAKVMHRAHKLIVRDRALVMPSYLAAEPTELAAWLDQFVPGTPAP